MEPTNSYRASCGDRSFCDPIQNPVHHQISHLRKALEPMSGFGNGLTSPGVARTIIAYPWLSAEKPISFRDRKNSYHQELKFAVIWTFQTLVRPS